ncbi:MAG: hypothetical protein GX571_03495, partial [Lentisphaerae bacterium]|nr:hypothetical protein [Lentisphaerota bacterium]
MPAETTDRFRLTTALRAALRAGAELLLPEAREDLRTALGTGLASSRGVPLTDATP